MTGDLPETPAGSQEDEHIFRGAPLTHSIGYDCLPDMFDGTAERFTTRNYATLSKGGKSVSYGEIQEMANKFAKGLQEKGIGKGSKIAVFMPNNPYEAAIVFGAMKTGAQIVNILYPANIKHAQEAVQKKIAETIRETGVDAIVTLDELNFCGPVKKAAQETGLGTVIVCPLDRFLPPVLGSLYNAKNVVEPPLRNAWTKVADTLDEYLPTKGDFTEFMEPITAAMEHAWEDLKEAGNAAKHRKEILKGELLANWVWAVHAHFDKGHKQRIGWNNVREDLEKERAEERQIYLDAKEQRAKEKEEKRQEIITEQRKKEEREALIENLKNKTANDMAAIREKYGDVFDDTGVERIVENKDPVTSVISFKSLTDNDGKYDPVEITRDDIALLQPTGGSTGGSKWATQTHGALLANVEQIQQHFANLIPLDQSGPDHDKMLAAIPNRHIFGFTVDVLYPASIGLESIMTINARDMKDLTSAFTRYKPSIFLAVPPLLALMNKSALLPANNLRFLKAIIGGGSAVAKGLRDEFERKSNLLNIIMTGYGLSEAGPVVSANNDPATNNIWSSGPIFPGQEVKIIGNDGRSRGVNEEGEILVRGLNVMLCYCNNPEETAKAIDSDGWLHTGDIGKVDENNHIHITGRIKRMADIGGNNVYAETLETTLSGHPDIEGAVALIITDKETRRDRVHLQVSLKKGADVSEEDINDFIRDNLYQYYVPSEIEFRNTPFPLTSAAKIDWKTLQDEEQAKHDAEETVAPAPQAPKPA